MALSFSTLAAPVNRTLRSFIEARLGCFRAGFLIILTLNNTLPLCCHLLASGHHFSPIMDGTLEAHEQYYRLTSIMSHQFRDTCH